MVGANASGAASGKLSKAEKAKLRKKQAKANKKELRYVPGRPHV